MTVSVMHAPSPIRRSARRPSLGAAKGSLTWMLVDVGNQLGLFDALARFGAITVPALAARTGFDEGFLSEWLYAMAEMGQVQFDVRTRRFASAGKPMLRHAEAGA